MNDYNDIRNMLRPRRDFKASDSMRYRISSLLDARTKSRAWFRPVRLAIATCATAVLLCLIFVPSGMSAKEILTETMNSLRDVHAMEMEVDVRTTPLENFRYISPTADFVTHKISILRTGSTDVWRVDKGGRVATGHGWDIYTWIDEFKIGRHFVNTEPKEVLGYLSTLLSPDRIMEMELANCIGEHESEYSAIRKGDDIFLTVKASPQGDFTNPYMLNASITESSNVRRYVIDAGSKRLKSATLSIVNDGKETVVLRISAFNYDAVPDSIFTRPADIRFIATGPKGIKGLSVSETAEVFLNALVTCNTPILDKTADAIILTSINRTDFHGAHIDSIGYPFISGKEGNTYIPYSIHMPDGFVKRHNLVLRQTSSGAWIIVGGL